MKLQVSTKRLLGAALLAVCCVLLLAVHVDLFMVNKKLDGDSLALVMALLLVSCYIQSVKFQFRPLVNGLWMLAGILVLPCVMVYIIEYLAGQDAAQMAPNIFWLNYFWCQVIYVLMFALTNHYRASVIVGSVFCFVVGAVNHFVLLFRSSPLQLTDVMSIGTAADVAGNYVIALNYDLLYAGSVVVFAVCLACVAEFHRKRRTWQSFIGCFVLLAFVLSGVNYFYTDKVWVDNNLTVNFWNPLQGYEENGTALSLAMTGKYLRPEKPEHYSEKKAEQIILAGLEGKAQLKQDGAVIGQNAEPEEETPKNAEAFADQPATQEKPNIIAIMNESYADLSILGDFKTSVPYMSFYQSLLPETIHGNLSVSVLGGGTCNSEFEFLTGLSTAFLPTGVMAYQQYINGDLDSMATILRDQGYRTLAFHPGKPDSWQRDKVYPHFGFEEFLTEKDMENPEYMREAYVTDSSNYQEVIRQFENKGDDKLFLFNVTIQNHGGYQLNTADIPKWVSLRGGIGRFPETEQYLSIMHASDKALQELITYFENVDEPTMIVFFGDHQPSVESAFVEKLLGQPLNTLRMEDVQKRYQVPFFIWANYDIEPAYYEQISANYLSTLALKTAGLELPPYNQYLYNLQQDLPMINALGYADNAGNHHYFSDETPETQLIEDYKVVQYNYLFGGRSRLNEMYQVENYNDDTLGEDNEINDAESK